MGIRVSVRSPPFDLFYDMLMNDQPPPYALMLGTQSKFTKDTLRERKCKQFLHLIRELLVENPFGSM